VDVVISSVNHKHISDQYKILAAIKEAGNIKVYINYFVLSKKKKINYFVAIFGITFFYIKNNKELTRERERDT
jgi:hypothetical protein